MTNSQMVIPIMEKRSGLYCWLYVSSLFFMGFFPLLMIFLLKQFQPISYLVSHLCIYFSWFYLEKRYVEYSISIKSLRKE